MDRSKLNGHAAPAAAASAFVSELHMARELVRADDAFRSCTLGLMWDTAQVWLGYRERLQDWRFDTLRGNRPPNLQLCPCGRIQQLEPGRVRCFQCGAWFVATNS